MLLWSWKDKCGECVVQHFDGEYTLNLYEGNAFLIFIYEYKEGEQEKYQMGAFWVDEKHMKTCLGLLKKSGVENIHKDIKKIRFNKAKSRNYKKIISALVQAFDNIEIEVYTE